MRKKKSEFEEVFPTVDQSVFDFSGPNIIDRITLDKDVVDGWKHLSTALAYEIQERSKHGKIKIGCGMEMAYEQPDGSLVLAINYTIGKKEEAITMLVPRNQWHFNYIQN